jgi:hypothetical protein
MWAGFTMERFSENDNMENKKQKPKQHNNWFGGSMKL